LNDINEYEIIDEILKEDEITSVSCLTKIEEMVDTLKCEIE
jgi:hypothetical protein